MSVVILSSAPKSECQIQAKQLTEQFYFVLTALKSDLKWTKERNQSKLNIKQTKCSKNIWDWVWLKLANIRILSGFMYLIPNLYCFRQKIYYLLFYFLKVFASVQVSILHLATNLKQPTKLSHNIISRESGYTSNKFRVVYKRNVTA